MNDRIRLVAGLFPRPVELESCNLGPLPRVEGAVSTEEAQGPEWERDLFPEEREALVRAVPKRRREFAVGRRCARAALSRLGYPEVPMPPNDDRSTPWPEGVVGSITHTDRWCGAAVARSASFSGLGIDAEPQEPIGERILERICTPNELHRISDGPFDVGVMARIVFSAKEAIYKAQFPKSKAFVGFHEVEVDLNLTPEARGGTFRSRWLADLPPNLPGGLEVQGRLVLDGELIVTAAYF